MCLDPEGHRGRSRLSVQRCIVVFSLFMRLVDEMQNIARLINSMTFFLCFYGLNTIKTLKIVTGFDLI